MNDGKRVGGDRAIEATPVHSAGTVPRRTAMPLAHPDPSDRPLTPDESLAKLFMDNADRGANAANDELIEELQRRIRALRKATRKDPGRPPVEPAPVKLPAADRHQSGRSDLGPGAVDAAEPVGCPHGSAASLTQRRCIVESHDYPGTVVFPTSDHFPLGRAYGRINATPALPSAVRPFGLTLAVSPRVSIRFDPAELGYDDVRQIGLIRDGGEMMPLSKHTDGTTNTQTDTDGHGERDSYPDHRED